MKKALALLLAALMLFSLVACGQDAAKDETKEETKQEGGSTTGAGNVDVSQITQSGSNLNQATADKDLDDAEKQAIIDAHTDADGKTFVTIASPTKCASFEPYKSIKIRFPKSTV